MAASTLERQTELAFGLEVSPQVLAGLAVDAARNFPREHPRWTGAMLGLALGWTKGAAAIHAQEGGTPDTVTSVAAVKEHVGPYVALSIAAGSGILAAAGNGFRVWSQERAAIGAMEEEVDKMTSEINTYGRMDPEDFVREYTMKCLKVRRQPDPAEASQYVAEQMKARPDGLGKMLGELKGLKAAILKKKASAPVVAVGEAGQALLGVTGAVTMVYYTARGMLEDFGKYGDDVLFKTLLVDGGVGALLPIAAMVRDIWEVESSSGGRGARTQGALKHLQASGIAPKPEKRARPKLEIGGVQIVENSAAGGNGSKPKFKVKVKQ